MSYILTFRIYFHKHKTITEKLYMTFPQQRYLQHCRFYSDKQLFLHLSRASWFLCSKKLLQRWNNGDFFLICRCRQPLGFSMALSKRSLWNRSWWSDQRLSTRRQTLGNIFAASDFQPKPTYFMILPTSEKGCVMCLRAVYV